MDNIYHHIELLVEMINSINKLNNITYNDKEKLIFNINKQIKFIAMELNIPTDTMKHTKQSLNEMFHKNYKYIALGD